MSGCVSKPKEELLPEGYNKENSTIKYINSGSILTEKDFPEFKPVDHVYFVSQENVSLTLESENVHRAYIVNASDTIPEGFRIYGGSELYNSSKRYILLQYKVFDKDDKLNDSLSITVQEYTQNGFKTKTLKDMNGEKGNYKGKIVVLENNMTNVTTTNMTAANAAMNIVVILFNYDTILGKIGVLDYNNKSINESLEILDIALDRLKVNTKQVKMAKIDTFQEPGSKHGGTYNPKNRTA